MAEDTRHIHTIELGGSFGLSTDDPNWAALVSLNAAYTYFPTYAEVLKGYNRPGPMPVFLVEACYDYESLGQEHIATGDFATRGVLVHFKRGDGADLRQSLVVDIRGRLADPPGHSGGGADS